MVDAIESSRWTPCLQGSVMVILYGDLDCGHVGQVANTDKYLQGQVCIETPTVSQSQTGLLKTGASLQQSIERPHCLCGWLSYGRKVWITGGMTDASRTVV